ncbi:hypothetical protein PRIEUP_LOCUS1709 [Pristimantis euphronides]
MGDFNIPVDLPHASTFLSLTSSFGLSQWSTSATHNGGHMLDLIFTHLCTLSNFTNSHPLLSDYNLLSFTSVLLSSTPEKQELVQPHRYLKHLNSGPLSFSLLPLTLISSQ